MILSFHLLSQDFFFFLKCSFYKLLVLSIRACGLVKDYSYANTHTNAHQSPRSNGAAWHLHRWRFSCWQVMKVGKDTCHLKSQRPTLSTQK